MHTDALPERTARVLEMLSKRPELADFALIGGSALALQVGHRMSEDLDFTAVPAKLPRQALKRVMDDLAAAGHDVRLVTDPEAREEWENDGADLDDHQQDWSIDGVKVTFFASSDPREHEIATAAADRIGSVRVASEEDLFELKSRLLTKRSTTRDLYDLNFMITKRGRSLGEVLAHATRANPYLLYDHLRERLLPARQNSADPGVEPVALDYPRTFLEVKASLQGVVDAHERAQAAIAKGSPLDPDQALFVHGGTGVWNVPNGGIDESTAKILLGTLGPADLARLRKATKAAHDEPPSGFDARDCRDLAWRGSSLIEREIVRRGLPIDHAPAAPEKSAAATAEAVLKAPSVKTPSRKQPDRDGGR